MDISTITVPRNDGPNFTIREKNWTIRVDAVTVTATKADWDVSPEGRLGLSSTSGYLHKMNTSAAVLKKHVPKNCGKDEYIGGQHQS